MRSERRRTPGAFRAIVYAVLVHAAIAAVLVVGFRWTNPTPGLVVGKPIEAAVVEDPRIKQQEQERRRAEEQRRREEEERKRQEAEAKKQEEERKQVEQQRRLDEERKQAEAKKQAELKRKQEEERKQAEQQRRQEEERKRAEAERKRQEAEAERKRQEAEAQRRRKAAEESLKQQLEAEEKARIEAARAARAASEADKYRALIRQKVSRYWSQPSGTSPGLRCLVRVRLVPGGEVLQATVVRGSGNPVFDRSVEAAVHKASPLPIPSDPDLFEYFREIEFLFTPEG